MKVSILLLTYTPDKWHATHVKQALLHGKHVACTKPFIDNLAGCQRAYRIIRKTGKKVFVIKVHAFLNL